MKKNSNYLNIFKVKEKKTFLFKNVFFDEIKKIKLSKKQRIWGLISIFLIGVSFVMRATAPEFDLGKDKGFVEGIKSLSQVIDEILVNVPAGMKADLKTQFTLSFGGISVIKWFLGSISDIQLSSISVVEKIGFGSKSMFDFLFDGLTIFAVIGCLYKLVVHFLNTERHDNVKAYTGYFQYLSIAVLFVFSDQIVNRVVGLNEGVNGEKLKEMTVSLSNQLDKVLAKDLQEIAEKIAKLQQKNEELDKEVKKAYIDPELGKRVTMISNDLKIWKLMLFDADIALTFKYVYFSIFIMGISSIMAVPAFILSIMVKVLLTVMVAGTKLVFLLAFIPGFENTWKTFMLNMLNILLWTPIFNALYGLIVALISGLMSDSSLGNGQIVWLTIVSVILAFQSLTLTTSAAGVIINGAGASMAGAMGSMATMNGINAGIGVAKGALGVAGAAVGVGMGIKGASTLGNISKSLSNIEKHMQK